LRRSILNKPLLGCIADDFTGGTDLCNMLVRGGMRTIQAVGIPGNFRPDADAIVVALKTRTIDPGAAINESLEALRWLRDAGCRQFFFKYCSTFDSTPKGNIGPVTEALMRELKTGFTIACPAFPVNRRTVFQGYLFVGDMLLSESGMRNHPLTPMTDANLVRVLQAQTKGRVGLVTYDDVARGPDSIRQAFSRLSAEGFAMAIVDAVSNEDLLSIGAACRDMQLVTGGSGVALGLPENFRQAGLLMREGSAESLPELKGLSAVVSGSCSSATNGQVREWLRKSPGFLIDPLRIAAGEDVIGAALQWARQQLPDGPVLIFSSADPAEVLKVQAELGAEKAGQLVEDALSRVAAGLVEAGVRKLVVAGGETAGAVVKALGVRALRIGPQIDPGVPWTLSLGKDPIGLALKSGNFGSADFFAKALDLWKQKA
jgi:uncharacterized protein YgbK (DUF1537 family)